MTGDDIELLKAWREGDAGAGETLTARHYDAVWRFFEVKIPSLAADMTQQTFLACVEARDRFEGRSSFRAYVFGIARRLLLQHLRRDDRFDRVQRFQAAASPDTVTTASRIVSRRQEQRLLLRALDRLSADMQIVVQLHYWEAMRPTEIAEVLDVPASTVSSRLMRARTQLREHLEGGGRRPAALDSLLGNLDGWARSLAGADEPDAAPSRGR